MYCGVLGGTGIKVSRLCFGTLTIGPLQARLSINQGAKLIRYAIEKGVNFLDTAEIYDTYPYIKQACQGLEKEIVIATRSYAYTAQDMQDSVKKACRELEREYIDVFLLHEMDSALLIKGHWPAVEYLLKAKEAGLVRALGISTHTVAGVRAATLIPEIDIIHCLINLDGIGISDGTPKDMLAAIKQAAHFDKGLYGMKALGGGHLISRPEEALSFVLRIPELASCAVGMQAKAEVDYNIAFFSQQKVPAVILKQLKQQVGKQKRRLHIENWCTGCGRCVERCHAKALFVVDGRVKVDESLCRLCGYCGGVCPEFCLKII